MDEAGPYSNDMSRCHAHYKEKHQNRLLNRNGFRSLFFSDVSIFLMKITRVIGNPFLRDNRVDCYK